MPNHQRPWTSFHTDAWLALMFFLLLPSLLRRRVQCQVFNEPALLLTLLMLVPGLQFLGGIHAYFGEIWINTLYLLGALLAVLVGRSDGEEGALAMIDWLFGAIVLAGVVSVGLQIYQLSGSDSAGIWIISENITNRPSANLNQPNRLATLELWAMLGLFWGWTKGRVSSWVVLPLAMCLLLGVALCNSRTTWLAAVLLTGAAFYWRALWPSRRMPFAVLGLLFWFTACVFVVNHSLPGNRIDGALAEAGSELRLLAWRQFAGAIAEAPWFGYGWGRTATAQILSAADYPPLYSVFAQAHNLFIDLILWCGIPLGGALSLWLLSWFWRAFRSVRTAESALLFMCLLVVANHAMLEFPLHYAHFLLPTGVMVGAFIARWPAAPVVCRLPKGAVIGLALAAVLMLGITIRDYFKVEHSYELLRIEWAGMPMELDPQPPSVLALTQLQAMIREARTVPRPGMSAAELQALYDVLLYAHRPIDFIHYIRALRLNGRAEEAQLWQKRLCAVVDRDYCVRAEQELAGPDLATGQPAAVPPVAD